MSEEVTELPPYPSLTDSSDRLFEHLVSFRDWVEHQQQLLTPLLPQAAVDILQKLPYLTVTSWETVCVLDKYLAMVSLRKFREAWDGLGRTFHGAWNSRGALRQRFDLVYDGASTLDSVFVHPEQREHFDAQQAANKQASPHDEVFEEWEF